MTTLTEDLTVLRDTKTERDEAKAHYEGLDQSFKQLQLTVKERMEQEGVDSLKADGTLFVPASTIYAQIQDREAFIEWALANEAELTERKERKELLNALVRERIDNGEALPPGVGFFTREYISQRAG